MREIDIGAERLVSALLASAENEQVCILDSCGVGHLGSHLLIAGVRPVESFEISGNVDETLGRLDGKLSQNAVATFFTLSYEFGRKLQRFPAVPGREPDLFAACFDCLVVHDYDSKKTFLSCNG